MGDSQSETAWSKEFVEHVRTVHFALIAVSVGLTVLVLSSRPYNPSTALRQIEEINDFAANWSFEWMMDYLGGYWGDENNFRKPSRYQESTVVVKYEPNKLVAGTVHWNTKSGKKESSRVTFRLPAAAWYPIEHTPYPYLTQKIKSLAEFEFWWNSLGTGEHHILAPSYVNTIGGLIGEDGPLGPEYNESTYVELSPDDPIDPAASPRFLSFAQVNDPEQWGLECFLNDNKREQIFIPFNVLPYGIVSREFMVRHFTYWKADSFPKAFYDLNEAAGGYTSLKLDDDVRMLFENAKTGSDVFEAVGMKFPAQQLTAWGLVVLVSIQLYFWIYLKRLSGGLPLHDPAWNFPWIGMDRSRPARQVLFLTFVLLPLCAAVSLTGSFVLNLARHDWGRPTVPASPTGGYWAFAFQITGLLVALGAVAYLGIGCWRQRPQVIEKPVLEATDAQLYE